MSFISRNNVYDMDMTMPRAWMDYFERMEPWITVTWNHLNAMIFKGNVGLSIAKKFALQKLDTDVQVAFQKFLKAALKYRRVLGVCPFIIHTDPLTGLKWHSIPPLGAVQFELRVHPTTLESSLSWRPDDRVADSGRAHVLGPMSVLPFTSPYDRPIPRTDVQYHVFVWPGYDPDPLVKQFKSDMAPLYSTFLELRLKTRDDLQASGTQAKPTLYVTQPEPKMDLANFQEKEFFADVMPGMENAPTYTRSTKKARRLEAMAQDKMESMVREGAGASRQVNLDTGEMIYLQRAPQWSDNLFVLQEGQGLASAQLAKQPGGLQEERESYWEMVCMMLGVPRKTMGATDNRDLRARAQTDQSVVMSTVEERRRELQLFYQDVWVKMYRTEEQIYLQDMLDYVLEIRENIVSQLEAKLAVKKRTDSGPEENIPTVEETVKTPEEHEKELFEVATPQEQERLTQIFTELAKMEKRVKKWMVRENKLTLNFSLDPFAMNITTEEIMMAADRDAISALEETNLFRKKMKLPPVTKDDGGVTRNESLRALKLEMAKEEINKVKAEAVSKRQKKTAASK